MWCLNLKCKSNTSHELFISQFYTQLVKNSQRQHSLMMVHLWFNDCYILQVMDETNFSILEKWQRELMGRLNVIDISFSQSNCFCWKHLWHFKFLSFMKRDKNWPRIKWFILQLITIECQLQSSIFMTWIIKNAFVQSLSLRSTILLFEPFDVEHTVIIWSIISISFHHDTSFETDISFLMTLDPFQD